MTDVHKADIKAAIEKAGTSMSAIARRHGLNPSAVRNAVGNFRPMPRVKALVAAAIGMKPQEIWPSLFDSHGRPRATSRQCWNNSTPHRRVERAA